MFDRYVLYIQIAIGSMYGIFTCIYHKIQLNVGKYTIHASYGIIVEEVDTDTECVGFIGG